MRDEKLKTLHGKNDDSKAALDEHAIAAITGPQREIFRLSRSMIGTLLGFVVIGLLLFVVGGRDYPNLHIILDTGLFLLSGILVLLLWDMGGRINNPFPKHLAVSFAVTSLLNLIHVMVNVEWSGALLPISQAADVLRPGTWAPSVHELPIGVGCSVWLMCRKEKRIWPLAFALLALSAGMVALFNWLPRYTSPVWLGITRPMLILSPVLWLVVGWQCWRLRAADRILPVLALMSVVLLFANVVMLYSRAPHDTLAMVAHLFRVGGYLVLLVSLMRMASWDMQERIRVELEVAELNQKLEQRVLDRTAKIEATNKLLEAEMAARKQLEQANTRLAAIVEFSDDAFISKDLNSIITSWNHGAERIFGYTAVDMVGTTILRLIPADRQAEEVRILDLIKRGEIVEHFETVRQTKDGRLIDVSVKASPIKDANGEIIGVSKVAHDITDRHRRERDQRALETRYRTLFDYAPDGIVIANTQSYYLDANASMCRMLGYTRDELIGLHASDIVASAEIQHIGSALSVLKNKSDYQREWQFRRKDGSIFPADVIATQMPDGNLLAMIRDITERKQTEQALRVSEERFRFLNDLVEATRTLADPVQIMAVMARMLGEHLRAARCAYADVETDGERFTILHDYTDGCASTVGNYQLSLFGARAVSTLNKGQTLIIRNVEAELLPGEGADMFKAIGIQAIITCPLVKEGRLRAMMAVHQTALRDWKLSEIAIVQDVVERCWATIERRTAEEKIRQLNTELERRVAERTAQLEAANNELRHSRAGLESLFESLPGLYLVLTPDLKIVSVSDAYLKATMTTREGILGRGLFEVFPDNPDELGATGVSHLRASLDRVMLNAAADTMAIQKYDVRRPDGVFEEHYWSPINSPVFGADRQIKYIVHRVEEVTEFVRQKSKPALGDTMELSARMQQMEAEIFLSSQKLQAANRQLEAANKELEAFSYSVSHDLRAPLRAVNGFAGIVLEDFGSQLPDEGKGYLERISKGGQRMGELIDDLLAFSRLSRQPLNRYTVDTNKLVQGVIDEESKSQQEGRRIEFKVEKLPACHGDLALLKQVWVNLLSNAIKYTRDQKLAVVEVGCKAEDGEQIYFVRDNGVGFDMRYANKLFGVFQRLHRTDEFEGTGVGLAIVQRIVHRHGGRVWADGKVNHGAVFYFTIEGENKI